LVSFFCFGLPDPHREKSALPFTDVLREIWPAVTRKVGDFFEQKKTKAAKRPSRSRTQKNNLCFLRCLLSKPSGEIITARPKNKSARRFFINGRKLV
jgi:hypothetical protein